MDRREAGSGARRSPRAGPSWDAVRRGVLSGLALLAIYLVVNPIVSPRCGGYLGRADVQALMVVFLVCAGLLIAAGLFSDQELSRGVGLIGTAGLASILLRVSLPLATLAGAGLVLTLPQRLRPILFTVAAALIAVGAQALPAIAQTTMSANDFICR